MTISASAIISFATPNVRRSVPGIQEEVRDRLEWNWGLGHHHLDEHLQGYVDPEGVLMDETLLVFPPNDIIHLVRYQYGVAQLGVRRPHILKLYNECTSFEYMLVPIDPASAVPARLVTLVIPPHLALCTTSGKMAKAWGALLPQIANPLRLSVINRSKTADHCDRPPLTMKELHAMKVTHRTWSASDCVPTSFRSESSDHTWVEQEEEGPVHEANFPSKRKLDWEAGSSASNREPKRRLLPCELQEDPRSVWADEDSVLGTDSHISGVDDPEEFAQASAARGDYKLARKRLEEIKLWAQGASGADTDVALLNDADIEQYIREQPRLVMNLDLDKADYLLRHSQFKNDITQADGTRHWGEIVQPGICVL
ncbi:hypothetical protein DFH06DRAFT_1184652 [Mycena polygramma]|nr:hypothetical protein DFH06DRAFT_1184652 [Mycena polygramma]